MQSVIFLFDPLLITVKGCTVTIDAMGCQQDIATKIIEQGANYALAVKENQKQLYQDIQDEFRFGKNIQIDISEELDHGRIETRKCSVISAFEFTTRSALTGEKI